MGLLMLVKDVKSNSGVYTNSSTDSSCSQGLMELSKLFNGHRFTILSRPWLSPIALNLFLTTFPSNQLSINMLGYSSFSNDILLLNLYVLVVRCSLLDNLQGLDNETKTPVILVWEVSRLNWTSLVASLH
ncbi:hypothetical protein XENOCAPTIV_021354 [Xenoophorus captivus]|uniref:Uncharacterized protein n=1 Tax=Xenoophorus captivus TaxID=1517983 RepID=A0ABV0RB71_9TELE